MKSPLLTARKFAGLKRSENWMVRFSQNGVAFEGFAWAPLGEWTTAPDWNERPECGGGLHGQGPGGYGDCPESNSTFEFCETRGPRVRIDGKEKVRAARILAIDDEAFVALYTLTDGAFPGSLYLRGYGHPL